MTQQKTSNEIDGEDGARELARAALASGARYSDAARLAGRSERTIKRWMSETAFRRSVAQARTEQVCAVTGRLAVLALDAVAVLQRSLASEDWAESLRAATLILQWSGRWASMADFALRLADIEQQLGLVGDEDAGAAA
jgi:hypothetical protein